MGFRFVDESHRARLRVEIGRLRRMLRKVADVSATRRGALQWFRSVNAKSWYWLGPPKQEC